MNKSILARLGLTVAAGVVFRATNALLVTAAPIVTGEASVKQLDNSDLSYMQSHVIMHSYPNGITDLVLVLVVIAIWWKYIRKLFASKAITMIGFMTLVLSSPAFAYYSTRDNPEYVEIGPNQSAFLIPMQGANKDTQAQFDSAQFLDANKVAAKRIQIPHVLIHNPYITESDYYVPSAKLIIVDRSPYQRDWAAGSRGTNANKDESFHTDTADGVNISIDISIAASVHIEDTALFLYNFGTTTLSLNTDDPAQNFRSVDYGRSLSDVMDTVVHSAVQAEIAAQFGVLKLSNIESQKIVAIQAVEKNIKAAFSKRGITIDFVGLASSINFDNPDIQKAMDELAKADMEVARAEKMQAVVPYLHAKADIDLENTLGFAITKWNGQVPNLPTVVAVPNDLANIIFNMFKSLSVPHQ